MTVAEKKKLVVMTIERKFSGITELKKGEGNTNLVDHLGRPSTMGPSTIDGGDGDKEPSLVNSIQFNSVWVSGLIYDNSLVYNTWPSSFCWILLW